MRRRPPETSGPDRAQRASLSDRLRNFPQYVYPQRLISAWGYRLTRIRRPWLKNRLIRSFIRRFGVDMSEAANADPSSYSDFNAFFTRPLRPGVRPLAAGEHTLCCPVDGIVSQAGRIDDDSVLQTKGRTYSLAELLGSDPERARPFRDGGFATLYLAPRDYHRVHMPISGRLHEMTHVPGRLFSVSPLTTRMVPRLFARNERVVTLFDTAAGPMAMVLVGAINVSSIETVWAGAVTPPYASETVRWDYPDSGPGAIVLERGAEMGRFNMGSTVIVLFGKDVVRWDPALRPETRVSMGQRLGELLAAREAQHSGAADRESQNVLDR